MSRKDESDINRPIRTQDEVAEIMGISRTTVSLYEREAIAKIAAAVFRYAGGASSAPDYRRQMEVAR